jgi:DNA repair ATPase RecN
MARARTTAQKDILSRVTDLGNEALHRLSEVPGGARLVEMANDSKSRLDDVQKKLRGLDALEKRVAKLEQQLAAQSKPPAAARKPAARKPAAKTSSTAKRSAAPKRPT